MSESGVKVMMVVRPRPGPSDFSAEVGLPREKVCIHFLLSRWTSAVSLLLSAFTTGAAHPVQAAGVQVVALVELPAEWRVVRMISSAGFR